MAYAPIHQRLERGGVIILDGGTGTELERRGVPMDTKAWCGPATLDHLALLEAVHRDYIAAGADIITTNTFASSPLMLDHAGFGDRFEEINRAAIRAARQAMQASGRADVAVAGSLSHMLPVTEGTDRTDPDARRDPAELASACSRLATLLAEEGCDLLLLEMMHHPERMPPAFEAAHATGLPVWAGFSARRGDDGQVLSFTREREIPFEEVVQILAEHDVAAAGLMHTEAGVIADALAILGKVYRGPLMAYPDSGYFKMPSWQFDAVMSPETLRDFAENWVASGVQVIGGCCGLSPAHIRAIADLKHAGTS
ncbi:MAG: homocysteine S-methyltransferase family protein [Alphaproteobacteria bacterium]